VNQIDNLIHEAINLISQSKHAIALTGAGVSTPSGIPDFRSLETGLWNEVDPMEVASIYAFRKQPQNFYDWFRPHLELMLDASPNKAHIALAQLEAQGLLKCLITQNIDTLHSRAGSQTIYEVHGNLREVTCLSCYRIFDASPILNEFKRNNTVPHCPRCGGVLKPNVILFGELMPMEILNQAKKHIMNSDLMLIAGSSLQVAPVSDLPLMARQAGARLIIVNLSKTYMDALADVVIHADVAEILPRVAKHFS